MFTNVPTSLLKLGLSFGEYENLARNLRRMSLISRRQRQEILTRAASELTPETINLANLLVLDMADDRKVYHIAGLKYWKGPPAEESLFASAVFDYLLVSRYFQITP